MSTEIDRLASIVAELQQQVKDLATQGVGLGYSSFDRGAITQYQPGSEIPASRFGEHYDGTNGVVPLTGPPPPQPALPTVESEYLGFLVTWDGTWHAGGTTVAPLGFSHVEVHATQNPELAGGLVFNTKRGPDIVSARGATVKVPAGEGDWYIWLIARSTAGKASAASPVVGPVAAQSFDLEEFGGNKIYRGPDVPTGEQKIGNLWLAEVDAGPPAQYETRRWEGAELGWQPAPDQRVTQALEDAFAAQQTADSKTVTIRDDVEPPTTGRTVGDEWIDEGRDNLRHVWSGTDWVEAPIGNSAITPNSLIASQVIATGTITAPLLEAILILATTIIAGDPEGNHARMTASGFEVYAPSPLVGAPPYRVVSMGNASSRDTFGVANELGQLLANIDENGVITATDFYTSGDPTIKGRKLLGELLWEAPRGFVSLGQANMGGFSTITEYGLIEVPWIVEEPGRAYELYVGGFSVLCTSSDAEFGIHVRYTKDGSTPTINSPILDSVGGASVVAGRWVRPEIGWSPWYAENSPVGTHYRFLLTLRRIGGTGSVSIPSGGGWVTFALKDAGPQVPFSQIVSTGGGSTTAPPVRRTATWPASWVESYKSDGTVMSNDEGQAYQGPDPSGFNGRLRALIGFPDITPTLAGSTIEKVEIYLFASHWYNGAGGTAIIGRHGLTGPPGNLNAVAPAQLAYSELLSGGWPRSAGRWVDITHLTVGNWVNGGTRGILVGNTTAAELEYYGRFLGVGGPDAPHLRITYLK